MFRDLLLRAEPLVFAAISPLISGKKARYQRSLMVQKYSRGHGAEIGALQQPMLVPRGARTSYIDLQRVPTGGDLRQRACEHCRA